MLPRTVHLLQNLLHRTQRGFIECLVASSFVFSIFASGDDLSSSKQTPPNIIFILADDLGWADLGCYGNQFNETPNIDDLAARGIRFTQAYASAPVCSPYRAALLTGQHPARLGLTDYLRPNSANALTTEIDTLPKVLSENGYMTGMIGKWHLTGYQHHGAEHEIRPEDHGFAWTFATETKGVGNGANFWPYRFRQQPISWIDISDNRLGPNEYLTDRLNIEAADFIDRHQDQPFLLYLSHYAPHSILNGRSDLVEKYRRKHPPGPSSRDRCYLCEDKNLGAGDPGNHWARHHNPHLAAMLESMDQGVGMIVERLKSLDLLDNTIIIFTSDNGGETNVTSNEPLRGGKSQLYEGGIRVPLIIHWPKVISEPSVSNLVTQNIDFYPTLLNATQIQDPNTSTDGISILKHIKNATTKSTREFIAWHYPLDHPHFLGGKSASGIRSGDWKLISGLHEHEIELYNLAIDQGEEHNVAEQQTEVVKQLTQQLSEWKSEVSARTPSRPFLVHASNLLFAEHFDSNHLSQRIWYNPNWITENGFLKRRSLEASNTRIFVKDVEYQDSIIRFDVRFCGANDIRLMTGNNGHYNTVLHLRRDHFFLQTAKDSSAGYESYRHGECEFDFGSGEWQSVTIEFTGQECVAHVNDRFVASAMHPMIDQVRDYLAIQVDAGEAEFDNFQLFSAKMLSENESRRSELEASIDQHPVHKSDEETIKILESNLHAWHKMNDREYQTLIATVEALDQQRKEKFPEVFISHKERRQEITAVRKQREQSDTVYRDLVGSRNHAKQAVDRWLKDHNPDFENTPSNQRDQKRHQLLGVYSIDPELKILMEALTMLESQLRTEYPQDYLTDAAIQEEKRKAAARVQDQPEFIELNQKRVAAFRHQQRYLQQQSEILRELLRKTDAGRLIP